MSTRHLLTIAALGLALTHQTLLAATQCQAGLNIVESNPDSIYIINNNETVTDTRTGLMWKRCSEGQVWSSASGSCTGTPTALLWNEALSAGVNSSFAGQSDWRLPNIKELSSLTEWCTSSPAINRTAFPGVATASSYWSSSPTRSNSSYKLSWGLNATSGAYSQNERYFALNVRLVRNFQALVQTIGTVTFTPATLAVGGTSALGATASSGLPVSFSSATGTCSVAGNVTSGYTVSGIAAGLCTVTATQSGNGSYAVATPVQGSVTVDKSSQTIGTIAFSSTFLAVGGNTTVSATASSGLAVSFSSSVTPTTCSVSGNTVTGLAIGTCTVTASQTGTVNYLAATPVTQSIQVKASQTISPISFSPGSLAVGGATTASATGGASGNPVTFSSASAASICTVTGGGLVTGVGVGSCVVAANQAGDGSYADAIAVTANITVNRGSQTIGLISFTPASLTVGGTTTVTASATSGLAVSFSSSPQSICTVSGGVVTGKSVGTCTVVANQAGNANYLPVDPPPAQNITVGKGSQIISGITFSPTTLAIGGTTTVSATSSSGLTVSFSNSATPTICSVSGTTVTGSLAGTCIITANQTGDPNYLAATPVTGDVGVKRGQTIGPISFTPATLAVGGTTVASAARGASSAPVTFSSTSLTSICTVTTGGQVVGVGVGSCVVAANQAGDNTYAAAPTATQSITVGQGSQTIGAITLLGSLSVGSTSTAQATASSGLPVSFGSSTPNTCTVTSVGTVHGVSAGPCTITADQAGDGTNYAAASRLSQGFTVLLNQTIGTVTFSSALVVGGTTTVSASGGGSANPVSFDSASPATCDVINGSTVRGLTAGTCTITANQAGDGMSYAAANPAAKNITVGLGSQTIGPISFLPDTLRVSGFTIASATATSGLPVIFSSRTPSVCTVSGTYGQQIIFGLSLGTCTIEGNQDGMQAGVQNYYAASPVTSSILSTNTIVFSPTSLTFDARYVGTSSAAKSVTLTNMSNTVLDITSLASTIDVFAVSNNTCGGVVAAGASCTFGVTFTPSAAVTRVGAITVISNAGTSPDNLTPVSGQGIASGAPICSLSAAPSRIAPGRSSTLTANCSATPTSYSWTGGTCAGTTGSTCTVSPAATTIYGVTATNGQGTSNNGVVATVTVKPVDLTPILMLLLD